MFELVMEDLTDEEIAAEAEEYGALAASVRRLIDATIRTNLRGAPLAEATATVDAVAATLAADQADGPYGVRFTERGTIRAWGNAAAGLRNPIAPPLDLQVEPDGRVWADIEMGVAYEGPPTLLHGGISALLMDQALGRAAQAAGVPGLTGTLEVRYVGAIPLGRVRVEAKLDRTEGVKSFVVGTISTDDGVCVEATGVFIMPKWARQPEPDPEPDRGQRRTQNREAQAASAGFGASPSEPTGHPEVPPVIS